MPVMTRQLGTLSLIARLSKQSMRMTPESVLGISLRHYYALNAIAMPAGGPRPGGGISQQRLGETMMLDANSVVLLLNELEAEGLVTRERDPADRRRHMVHLTTAGEVRLGRARAARNAIEDEVLASLSPQEREQLHALLTKALGG